MGSEAKGNGSNGSGGGFKSKMEHFLYSGDKKHVMAGIAIITVIFGVPWYLMNRGEEKHSLGKDIGSISNDGTESFVWLKTSTGVENITWSSSLSDAAMFASKSYQGAWRNFTFDDGQSSMSYLLAPGYCVAVLPEQSISPIKITWKKLIKHGVKDFPLVRRDDHSEFCLKEFVSDECFGSRKRREGGGDG
ncbi:hypothetical protein RCOM_1442110 [Ricinus communis]|uniref:Uncharacterized protein n=1 Tax=Ricinus communis TaxID=3988 RepID=B9RGM6_RICCO|nr:hypothetical protein RCOM_1442110 [Ricinus communis]